MMPQQRPEALATVTHSSPQPQSLPSLGSRPQKKSYGIVSTNEEDEHDIRDMDGELDQSSSAQHETPFRDSDDNDKHDTDGIMMTTNNHHNGNTPSTSNHPPFPVTRATYIYAMCAALNSVNLGYDLGVSTNAGPLLEKDMGLAEGQLELFLGFLNFWSIFGALLSPIMTDRFGRTITFLVVAILFALGVILQASAPTYRLLMVGRTIVGLAVGVGEAVDPLYIAECSPAHVRGELVSWAEAGVALGVVLGFASSLCFDLTDVVVWRKMIALGAIMPMVMILLVLSKVMPESPRWLVQKKRSDEAYQVLQTIYPSEETCQQVIHDIHEALRVEEAAAHAVGWTALLCRPTPAIRRMLIVGVGMATIQQAVGIDSIMFYLMFVIQASGISSPKGQSTALILLGIVKLGFVFVGARLLDRWGRRKLLFTSLLGCAASLAVVSATISSDTAIAKITLICALASYLAFFSSGLGPGNWVVVSEIFALSIRAKAMSIAILPNRVTATIMASTFLTVAEAITWPGFFLLLTGICLVSCLFLFVYLPETAGRSLEEMAAYFAEITGDRSILDIEEKLHSDDTANRDTEVEMGPLGDEFEDEGSVKS